jgi:NAD(P)-dependent dehydrogenase (short-subunit alcohol dehydrogenase family)
MATWVITGAARGIGLAMVRALRARGDSVVAACRRGTPELAGSGARVVEDIDVAHDAGASRLASALAGASIDVLVHNAGIARPAGLGELDLAHMREEYEVNALGPLRVTRALLPGLGAGAKIAVITSRAGSIGDNASGGLYGYRMSKAAVNMAGVSLARDLAPRGIAVLLLHPGMVSTDMLATAFGGLTEAMRANPLVFEADEIAPQLLARIDELTLETSGRFLHRDGQLLPW